MLSLSSSAQVTDTTTFTSEKRRQQEDAWLYETCTRCLQHLVDVFVQVGAGLMGGALPGALARCRVRLVACFGEGAVLTLSRTRCGA